MRYLRSTANMPLSMRAGFKRKLQIFTDASHAGDPDTRRSISGVVIKLAGNTVFWCSLYQKIVSHSSCESELMALDKGATVGQYVTWLLEVMGGPTQSAVTIFVDNKSTIDVSSNPIQPGRNLHVYARYFYIRDLVYAKVYELQHLGSELQVSDVLCTYKSSENFRKLCVLLMRCAVVHTQDESAPAWDLSLIH